MHKRLMTYAAVLALGLVGVTAQPASATHSWAGYHWARSSNPFTLKLGDNLSSTWKPYLSTTSSDWSKSAVLDTTIVAGSTSAKKCAATAGRVQVCNAAYGQRGWLGIASVNVSGTHITQGTVKLNDTYFAMAQYNNPAERNVVMCQEVGHTLGLDHQDEDFNNADLGTCMDYSNNPAPNQHPNQHDYDMLGSIYNHVDNTSTVGAAAPQGSGPTVGNSRKSWGTKVQGSRQKGVSTYVKDLGRGQKVVTHVIWSR